jgi:ketosteroid isomerase-like protein
LGVLLAREEEAAMTLHAMKHQEEEAIRAEMESIIESVRAKDVNAFLAHCSPDVVVFDMLPPLKHEGVDAVRASWKSALQDFVGRADYEVIDLGIAVNGDVAFCLSLNRFGGTTRDGKLVNNWLRSTIAFRKIEGLWKIVHHHVSVPFDMRTGKARVDLEP